MFHPKKPLGLPLVAPLLGCEVVADRPGAAVELAGDLGQAERPGDKHDRKHGQAHRQFI